jgi:DNA-binding MarR family transcriptional regulator
MTHLAIGRVIRASKSFASHGWTPIESAVMRFVDDNPGTTAGAVADATRLVSSNVSRALRALEAKGLIRRDVDPEDARRVLLYPTDLALENLQFLHDRWSRLLAGVIENPDEITAVNAVLKRIESGLMTVAHKAERAATLRPPSP